MFLTEPHPSGGRDHHARDGVAFPVLVHPVPNFADSATQVKVVGIETRPISSTSKTNCSRRFFWFKSVVVIIVSVATVIAMTSKAGGTGDIWKQQYSVYGPERSWLILRSMMSVAGGWVSPRC